MEEDRLEAEEELKRGEALAMEEGRAPSVREWFHTRLRSPAPTIEEEDPLLAHTAQPDEEEDGRDDDDAQDHEQALMHHAGEALDDDLVAAERVGEPRMPRRKTTDSVLDISATKATVALPPRSEGLTRRRRWSTQL
jgi:hypothetical protein